MDEDSCMVDIARYFLSFTQDESCGKCVMCRLGTKQMLTILENICNGKATMDDLTLLSDLCVEVKAGSLCQLGQTAPNPVLTTLKYFRHEYEDSHQEASLRRGCLPGYRQCPVQSYLPGRHIDVPRYIRFVADGNPDAALAVIREKIPFPSVCGLVCFHPCEAEVPPRPA